MNKTHLIMAIWLLISHNTVYTKALQLQATWLQYNLDRPALNNDAFSSNMENITHPNMMHSVAIEKHYTSKYDALSSNWKTLHIQI